MKIFDSTKIPILSKALDAYSLRHKVISSNLANITTVGYRSKSVSFEEQLSGALQGQGVETTATASSHTSVVTPQLNGVQPAIVEANVGAGLESDPTASGINDVDIDTEMTELAKNQLRFKFASKILGDTFRGIQKSIRGQV
jgi:flagellar basal-body rod protein FlgB